MHSIKFFDNNEFAEFLFYNSFIDLSLIGDKVIACIDIKRHDKTFIIDLLKNINNADSFNLFVIFQKTYKIDFDIASVLFRKSNLKEFLINNQINVTNLNSQNIGQRVLSALRQLNGGSVGNVAAVMVTAKVKPLRGKCL